MSINYREEAKKQLKNSLGKEIDRIYQEFVDKLIEEAYRQGYDDGWEGKSFSGMYQ